MALNNIWEIVAHSRYVDTECINVYHARDLGVGMSPALAYLAFHDTVLQSVNQFQTTALAYTSVSVTNLGDVTQFAVFDASDIVGEQVGEALPQHDALAVQFNRTRRDIRNGQKRWSGIPESAQLNGAFTAAFLAIVDPLIGNLLTGWVTDANPTVVQLRGIVLKRICAEVDAEGKCVVYRLPETDAELEYFDWSTATIRQRVSSQVSRKRVIS